MHLHLKFVIAAFALVLGAVAAVGAPVSARNGVAAEDVAVRDQLIADQENLLNAYRCLFDTDTGAVAGGCGNPEPVVPGAVPPAPAQADLDTRDSLIRDQEALLNAYRCQYSIDVEVVPDRCRPAPPEPEPEPEPLRVMTVEELEAVEEHWGLYLDWVPNRGDASAELQKCVDLGIEGIKVFKDIDSEEKLLAVCSMMYRGAAFAINYGFADPACVHEKFRIWVQQPDRGALRFWARDCPSMIDPDPDRPWFHRCIALAKMVSPRVASVGNAYPHLFTSKVCKRPPPDQIEKTGRCAELMWLYGAGMAMGALADQPENQWELLLDFQPVPRDMLELC